MNIKFDLEKFPTDTIRKYAAESYFIEGTIIIQQNNKEVLLLPEWPFIEFLVALLNWKRSLTENTFSNFYYVSMEAEEEPILSFTYRKNLKLYEVNSCWLESDIFFLSKNEILDSIEDFYHNLKKEVLNKYQYSIDNCIPEWSNEIGI
ncbi:MAG: hypothetical protein PHO65_08030 [Sulfurovum sp.]|nr:hypothetical protein [Sulfurovum sp.]